MLLILSLFVSCSKTPKDRSADNDSSPLGLESGREYDEEKCKYTILDLDAIPELIHFEFDRKWFYSEGEDYNIYWHAQLGLHIDSVIPQNIWHSLQPILNENFTEHISYDAPFYSIYANEIAEYVQTPNDYAKKWENLMDKFSETMKPTLAESVYYGISHLRVCGVIHKVFDNKDWETYLIEFSFEYHGGCGCHSYADYISFNKHDGHRLTEQELYRLYDKPKLSEALIKEFNKAKEKAGRAPTGDPTLINDISGFAFIEDGVLVYFHPYVAGCGAEGQHNIIIKDKDMK